MKTWIMNFIADERGAESVEFGVGALVIAGGSAAGLSSLKDNIQTKTDDLIDRMGEVGAD